MPLAIALGLLVALVLAGGVVDPRAPCLAICTGLDIQAVLPTRTFSQTWEGSTGRAGIAGSVALASQGLPPRGRR
jgi:hypothetical protein